MQRLRSFAGLLLYATAFLPRGQGTGKYQYGSVIMIPKTHLIRTPLLQTDGNLLFDNHFLHTFRRSNITFSETMIWKVPPNPEVSKRAKFQLKGDARAVLHHMNAVQVFIIERPQLAKIVKLFTRP